MVRVVLGEIMAGCMEAELVQGDERSADGSFVEANARKETRRHHRCAHLVLPFAGRVSFARLPPIA
ncbi:MAG TPA: hypothetical protein VN946_01560 [Terriglobales bacterium]|jgi:hypothetical protein|nr:hypothetical protein [Terriglobales bacterium]